jgi:hypothetical protein
MTFHIDKKYLWIGGAAVAAGLLYWYLKSSGIWDSWFNSAGNLVPAPPVEQTAAPGAANQPGPQQQPDQPSGFSLSFQPEKVN